MNYNILFAMKNLMTPRFIILSSIVLLAAICRVVPHAPNFTPIAAIALFGGANFNSRWVAFIVPLAAMFISDLFIGFHSLMPVVYFTFAVTVLIGFFIRNQQKIGAIAIAAIASSALFFIVTNFAVWFGSVEYPQNAAGLMTCYSAAVPFYKNSVLGDLFYSAVLFGLIKLVEIKYPVLAKQK